MVEGQGFRFVFYVFFLFFIISTSFARSASEHYSSTEIFVQPRSRLSIADNAKTFGIFEVDARLKPYDIAKISKAYPRSFGDPALARELGLDRYYVVSFKRPTNVVSVVNALNDSALSEFISKSEVMGLGELAMVPNDPYFSVQQGLHGLDIPFPILPNPMTSINAPEGWDIHTGLRNTRLAIIDSGVGNHPEYSTRNEIEVSSPNDRVLWNLGINTALNTTDPHELTDYDAPHGTHVTGIAAGGGNDGVGIAGINWQTEILPIRISGEYGAGTEAFAGAGVIWAADHGAQVANMSLQFTQGTTFFRNSIIYAYAHRVVLVAAAGNSGQSQVAYPARFPYVISVGAVDNQDHLASFSNYGPDLDLVAPGVDIFSSFQFQGENHYAIFSGTSMAAPHVAGLATLMLSLRPDLWPVQVERILKKTATDLGIPGRDNSFGYGRIDMGTAMRLTQRFCIADFDMNFVLNDADRTTFQAALAARDELADLDHNRVFNAADIAIFEEAFIGGCW